MKTKRFFLIVGIISLVAALSAALTAFFIVKDKQKKDDEELMEYLDSAIE
jgi:hypothetical protein